MDTKQAKTEELFICKACGTIADVHGGGAAKTRLDGKALQGEFAFVGQIRRVQKQEG